MKKILSVLSLCLILVFCGCSNQSSNSNTNNTNNTNTTYKADEPTEDLISIEACRADSVTVSESYFYIQLKARNLTDEKFDLLNVNYQVLDSNGDILYNRSASFNDVESGQASLSSSDSIDLKWSEMASIKLLNYSVSEKIDSYTYSELYSYDFIEPIIIEKANIEVEY